MIISELVMPGFGHIIQELINDTKTEDKIELHSACERLWMGIDALNKVTCCFKKGGEHASMSVQNEMGRIAKYIETRIGIDPTTDKTFGEWR